MVIAFSSCALLLLQYFCVHKLTTYGYPFFTIEIIATGTVCIPHELRTLSVSISSVAELVASIPVRIGAVEF